MESAATWEFDENDEDDVDDEDDEADDEDEVPCPRISLLFMSSKMSAPSYILNSAYEFDEDAEDDEDDLLRRRKYRIRRLRAVQCSMLLWRSVTGIIFLNVPIFNLYDIKE